MSRDFPLRRSSGGAGLTKWSAAVLAAACLFISSPSRAEDLAGRGARLRITTVAGGGTFTGRLAFVGPNEIAIETQDHQVLKFPLSGVRTIETRRETTAHVITGGALGVAAVPIGLCAATRPCLGRGTVALAAVGGLLGALIADRIWPKSWARVGIDGLRVEPSNGVGMTATIAIAF